MNRADMDFRFKGLFPVKMQEVCTDVFISCIYVFMLKQKEIFFKKTNNVAETYASTEELQGVPIRRHLLTLVDLCSRSGSK